MKLNCNEFASMYKKGDSGNKVLLDVRDPSECAEGVLKGSINIPVVELENRFAEIPKDKEIYIYCKAGGRAEKAEMFLIHKGIKVTRFANPGGYEQLKDLF
jgi:phage shock protein E